MPNWVYHDLKITGPEVDLTRFLETCFTTGVDGPRLDFDRLIPQPEHIKTSTDRGGMVGDGFRMPDWLDWNCQNWGTKWNAADTKVSRLESGAVSLIFETAWAPPGPIFKALAERFPLLTIEGEIVDMISEFGGRICCHCGKIDFEDKSEQIKAEMAEFYANLEREPTTIRLGSIDEDVPF